MRLRRIQTRWKWSWQGCALPDPPHGQRRGGKPGFPIPQPLLGSPGAPLGRRVGKPGSPVFQERLCLLTWYLLTIEGRRLRPYNSVQNTH